MLLVSCPIFAGSAANILFKTAVKGRNIVKTTGKSNFTDSIIRFDKKLGGLL